LSLMNDANPSEPKILEIVIC